MLLVFLLLTFFIFISSVNGFFPYVVISIYDWKKRKKTRILLMCLSDMLIAISFIYARTFSSQPKYYEQQINILLTLNIEAAPFALNRMKNEAKKRE